MTRKELSDAIKQLAQDEGYDDVMSMLEASVTDSMVPGLCVGCGYTTTECEPDAVDNHCDECDQPKVRSVLVLAGVI